MYLYSWVSYVILSFSFPLPRENFEDTYYIFSCDLWIKSRPVTFMCKTFHIWSFSLILSIFTVIQMLWHYQMWITCVAFNLKIEIIPFWWFIRLQDLNLNNPSDCNYYLCSWIIDIFSEYNIQFQFLSFLYCLFSGSDPHFCTQLPASDACLTVIKVSVKWLTGKKDPGVILYSIWA